MTVTHSDRAAGPPRDTLTHREIAGRIGRLRGEVRDTTLEILTAPGVPADARGRALVAALTPLARELDGYAGALASPAPVAPPRPRAGRPVRARVARMLRAAADHLVPPLRAGDRCPVHAEPVHIDPHAVGYLYCPARGEQYPARWSR